MESWITRLLLQQTKRKCWMPHSRSCHSVCRVLRPGLSLRRYCARTDSDRVSVPACGGVRTAFVAYSSRTDEQISTKLGVLVPWEQEVTLEVSRPRNVLSSCPVENVSCSSETKQERRQEQSCLFWLDHRDNVAQMGEITEDDRLLGYISVIFILDAMRTRNLTEKTKAFRMSWRWISRVKQCLPICGARTPRGKRYVQKGYSDGHLKYNCLYYPVVSISTVHNEIVCM
jgi:hypothetical protein